MYERGEERQRQYIHSLTDVKLMLQGFDVKICDGVSYKRASGRSERLLFICIKK